MKPIRMLALVAFLPSVALLGCFISEGPYESYSVECWDDWDCPYDMFCTSNGFCRHYEGCAGDFDCASGYYCAQDGACLKIEGCYYDWECQEYLGAGFGCFGGTCAPAERCYSDYDCRRRHYISE